MDKYIVTFNRGSGDCYDEEVRYFEALNFELVNIAVRGYKEKYLGSKWQYYISQVGTALDEFGSEYVSAHYG